MASTPGIVVLTDGTSDSTIRKVHESQKALAYRCLVDSHPSLSRLALEVAR